MRGTERGALFGALLVAVAIASGVTQAEAAKLRAGNHGQVFILSGFMGETLSPGLEAFADKVRARGISVTLSSHSSVSARADEAAAAYRAGNQGSIVVVGHSLGATAVSFGSISDLDVPANVAQAVNYYQSASMSKGKASGGAGFRGAISNIDLERSGITNHFNMVQGSQLQTETLNRIVSLVSARQDHPAASASTAPTTPPAQSTVPAPHAVY